MLLKLQQIEQIYSAITDPEILKVWDLRFHLKLLRNKREIEKEFDIIRQAIATSPKMIEYENKKNELQQQYMKVDENWHPQFADDYKFKLNELVNEYNDEIKNQEDKIKEAYWSEYEINLQKLNSSDLPENMNWIIQKLDLLINLE